MKNALQKLKSFKNQKFSYRFSNYIRRLQGQSRRLQNQLFHRLPAELRRRYPSLNRLPDLRTIQHSPKLVMGLAGGLVGCAFLMILCLRFLFGSGGSTERQISQLPMEATTPADASTVPESTVEPRSEVVATGHVNEQSVPSGLGQDVGPSAVPNSGPQQALPQGTLSPTAVLADQSPTPVDPASVQLVELEASAADAPQKAAARFAPKPDSPAPPSRSEIAAQVPSDATDLEILELPTDGALAGSSVPASSDTSPPAKSASTPRKASPTTTKTVSLSTSEPLPFEILEVEESPAATTQAVPSTRSADGGALEVLDLEGTPPAKSETASSSSEGNIANEDRATAPNETLTPQERTRLRRFRRIEATIAKHPEDTDKAHRYGVWLVQLGELERAERFYLWYLRSHPEDAESFFGLGQLYEATQRWQNACKAYQRAAVLDERHELARIHAARLLASCPDDLVRDGKLAIQFAQEANALSEWPKPSTADILAAAFAEAGNFASAVRVQKWAIRSAPVNERIPMAYKLELYRNKQPFRFTVSSPSTGLE